MVEQILKLKYPEPHKYAIWIENFGEPFIVGPDKLHRNISSKNVHAKVWAKEALTEIDRIIKEEKRTLSVGQKIRALMLAADIWYGKKK